MTTYYKCETPGLSHYFILVKKDGEDFGIYDTQEEAEDRAKYWLYDGWRIEKITHSEYVIRFEIEIGDKWAVGFGAL